MFKKEHQHRMVKNMDKMVVTKKIHHTNLTGQE
jgi:hypothetical protein